MILEAPVVGSGVGVKMHGPLFPIAPKQSCWAPTMFLTIVVEDVVRVKPSEFIAGCSGFNPSASVAKGGRRITEQAARQIASIAKARGGAKTSETEAQRADDLNDPVLALIFRKLTEKHAGKVVHGQGVCMCVYEVLEMGKWKLVSGEGAAVSVGMVVVAEREVWPRSARGVVRETRREMGRGGRGSKGRGEERRGRRRRRRRRRREVAGSSRRRQP